MKTKSATSGAACLLTAMLVVGCASPPANYAAGLSQQDPKWNSPQCRQIRAQAAAYEAQEKKTMSLAAGMLLGPYGVGIALAGKDARAKRRQQFNDELRMQCSSAPVRK